MDQFLKRVSAAVLVLFLYLGGSAEDASGVVTVCPDIRLELLSLIFHYAGCSEFSRCGHPGYEAAMETHFAELKTHPVIGTAREFQRRHSVSYDAIPSLAFRLTSIESPQIPADALDTLDHRWPREKLDVFLEQLNDFARRSNFAEFHTTQLPLYHPQCEFWRKYLEQSSLIAHLERFYGDPRPLRFTINPSMFENGGTSDSMEQNHEFHLHLVSKFVSPEFRAPAELPSEVRQQLTIKHALFLAHEFSHPWTNPVTSAIYPQIQTAAEEFFTPFREAMSRMGYGKPETMMIETFNRAAALVLLHDLYGEETIPEYIEKEKGRGFVLVEPIYRTILAERKNNPPDWHYSDGAAAYIDCVNSENSRRILDEFLHARELAIANAPAILSITPADGATDVDPETTELVIVFNKHMKPSAAVYPTSFNIPEIRSAAYNADGTIFTIQWKLEPDTDYAFKFNLETASSGFISTDGGVLPVTLYRFRTAPASAPPLEP